MGSKEQGDLWGSWADRVFWFAVRVARRHVGFAYAEAGTGTDTIAYLDRPGSGEAIVLLHGFAANKDVWLRFARHIPSHYRVIAIDLPGHGDSGSQANASYRPAELAARIVHTTDLLNLDRFHVAGNSLGGWVAALIAAERPQQILSLGLISAVGVYPTAPSELQIMLERGHNPLIANNRADFNDLMDLLFFRRPPMPWPIPHALTRLAQSRYSINSTIFDDIYANLLEKEIVDLLPAITMPTLILWGDKDRVLHVSSAEVFHDHLPLSQVVIMKHCGHAPIIERPGETAAHYLAFLRDRENL